jgi:hypothetical protein
MMFSRSSAVLRTRDRVASSASLRATASVTLDADGVPSSLRIVSSTASCSMVVVSYPNLLVSSAASRALRELASLTEEADSSFMFVSTVCAMLASWCALLRSWPG